MFKVIFSLSMLFFSIFTYASTSNLDMRYKNLISVKNMPAGTGMVTGNYLGGGFTLKPGEKIIRSAITRLTSGYALSMVQKSGLTYSVVVLSQSMQVKKCIF